MIYGVVNVRREATLSLVIGNSNGQRQVIDTVVDTGFMQLSKDHRQNKQFLL